MAKKPPRIEDNTRRQISEFLPDAISTALKSYKKFYGATQVFSDAKEFSAHHSACKAAIAHVELLIKLAKWADLPAKDVEKDEDAELAMLLASAQAELEKLQEQETLENNEN